MNNKYFKLYSFFINAIKTCRYSDTWQSLKKCDVLLVRNDVDCAYMHQGMAYGHLIDTIGELFDKKGLVVRSVATPYAKLFGNSAFNTPVNLNRATLLIDSFGIIVRLLKGAMFYTNWVKRYKIRLWGKILKKANPSFIIAIMPCESLCQAGKLSNVLVYDLQHGVIADEHWYYGYKTRLDADVRDLPDCFLCWDIQSKTYLQKWTQEKGIGINVIGNPWFSRFAFPDRDDQLVNHAINSGKIFNNENPTILFTLAWGMRKEYLDVDFNGVMIAEL